MGTFFEKDKPMAPRERRARTHNQQLPETKPNACRTHTLTHTSDSVRGSEQQQQQQRAILTTIGWVCFCVPLRVLSTRVYKIISIRRSIPFHFQLIAITCFDGIQSKNMRKRFNVLTLNFYLYRIY